MACPRTADEQLRASGMEAREALLHAAERRRRPILMTAIATVCGMFPLALALGAGSHMLLNLVVTPVVYYHLTRKSAR
jgi:multidrug efflux pump subunit AcrB